MALGAVAAQVVGAFVRRATVPLGLGLSAGLSGAGALDLVLQTWLVQINPPTLLSVATLLVVVALVAAFIPARRAARVDHAYCPSFRIAALEGDLGGARWGRNRF